MPHVKPWIGGSKNNVDVESLMCVLFHLRYEYRRYAPSPLSKSWSTPPEKDWGVCMNNREIMKLKYCLWEWPLSHVRIHVDFFLYVLSRHIVSLLCMFIVDPKPLHEHMYVLDLMFHVPCPMSLAIAWAYLFILTCKLQLTTARFQLNQFGLV